MTLRLPKPLPYDVVDELIDEQYKFDSQEIIGIDGEHLIEFVCFPGDGLFGNFSRPMIQLLNDSNQEWEDEDGYMHWEGGGEAYVYTVEELSDEEIDIVLRYIP